MAGEENQEAIRAHEGYVAGFDELIKKLLSQKVIRANSFDEANRTRETNLINAFFVDGKPGTQYPSGYQYQGKPEHYSFLSMAYHFYTHNINADYICTQTLSILAEKIVNYDNAGELSCFKSKEEGEGKGKLVLTDIMHHVLHDIAHPRPYVEPYKLFPLLTRLINQYEDKPGETTPLDLGHALVKMFSANNFPGHHINELQNILTAYFKLSNTNLTMKQDAIKKLLLHATEPYKILTYLLNQGVLDDAMSPTNLGNSGLKEHLKKEYLIDEKKAFVLLLHNRGLYIGEDIIGIVCVSDEQDLRQGASTPARADASPADSAAASLDADTPFSADLQEGGLESENKPENSPTEPKTSSPTLPIIALALGVMGLAVSLPLFIPMLLPMLTATTLSFTAPLIPFVVLATVAVVSLVGLVYGAVTLMPKIFQALSSSGGKLPGGGDSDEYQLITPRNSTSFLTPPGKRRGSDSTNSATTPGSKKTPEQDPPPSPS